MYFGTSQNEIGDYQNGKEGLLDNVPSYMSRNVARHSCGEIWACKRRRTLISHHVLYDDSAV